MFENIEWKLIAKDEASGVWKTVAAAQREVGQSSRDAADGAGKMASSWQSVFAGVAGWDLLKKAVRGATDFVKESVEASTEAEAVWAIVKQNIENAGYAFDAIGPKIKTHSQLMIQMGFDDEETASSVSRLLNATRDYNQALTLNQLAMDLARNKNIGLAEATNLVIQVTAGNSRVLKQYGIDLDETATAADNLAALTEKVRGSTEAYAATTAGQLGAAKVQWQNIKEEVGGRLQPTIIELLNTFKNNLPQITAMVTGLADGLVLVAKGIEAAGNAWISFGDFFKDAGKTINAANNAFGDFFQNAGAKFGDWWAGSGGTNNQALPAPKSTTNSTVKNQSVEINMGGVTVRNEADENRLVDKLVRQLQLTGIGSQ